MKIFKSSTKNIVQGFIFGFIIALSLLLAGGVKEEAVAQSQEFTVCQSGCSYASIQAAINIANAGDKIVVYSGTYYENIVVNKSVILEGVDTGEGKPIIDARRSGTAATLTSDEITFDNFKVINSRYSESEAGIMVRSNKNIIKNSDFLNNYIGVRFYYSNDNSFINNSVSNNFTGVYVHYSNNNTLADNTISSNGYQGVYHYYSSNNTFERNEISGNDSNFSLVGWENSHYTNSVDTSNTVDGKPALYLLGAKDQVFDSSTNAGLFYCINCDNITVKDLILSKNRDGILFYNTHNSRIENVTVLNNKYNGIHLAFSNNNTIVNNNSSDNFVGIYLIKSDNNLISNSSSFNNDYGIWDADSDKNTIEKNNIYNNETGIRFTNYTYGNYAGNIAADNNISNNSMYGIRMESFNNNVVKGNDISNNRYGVNVYSSANNTITNNTISNNKYGVNVYAESNKIYHNNFLNNIYYNARGSYSANNQWDNGYPSGGNYWSDYAGADEKSGPNQDQPGSDGIGDAAYTFIGGVDRYPFMEKDGWETIPPPPKPPDPSLSISSLKQFKSDGVTQIVEESTTTESAVVFKAIPSDLDNNQVKIQIELRQKDEPFSGMDDGGILNSDLVGSGGEAAITKNDLADGEYRWRARAMDAEGNFSEWQEFGDAGNVDFAVKTVPLYTQVRSPYPSDDETNKWAVERLGNGGTGGYAIYNFNISAVGDYTLTINGKDDNAANGARATLEASLYKLPISKGSFRVFRTMKWPDGDDAYKEISNNLGSLPKGSYSLYLTSIIDYFDIKYKTTGDETYDLNVYLDWLKITANDNDDIAEIKMEAEDRNYRTNLKGGYEKQLDDKTIVIIDGYDCGRNIADCGCAMTSLAMIGRYYDIKKGIDESDVNPLNFNEWLSYNGGYDNGRIKWWKGIEYLGFVENGEKKIRLSLDYHNELSASAIVDDNYINKNKPAIGQNIKFGHFFVLDGKIKFGPRDNDYTHTIKDPYWYNTKTLRETKDAANHIQNYNNYYDTANLFSYLETPKKIASAIWLYLASPAEFLVTDPSGKKLGKDPINEIDYSEIPDGYYTEEMPPVTSDEAIDPEVIHPFKIIYIPAPLEGNYNIQVIGTDSGNYSVDATVYDNEGNSHSQVLCGNTQTNLITDYNLNFIPDNPENIIFQPSDQTAPNTSVFLSGEKGNNDWFLSDVQATLSAQDNENGVGVFRTEYSLDGGNLWLEYTQPIMFYDEGIHSIMYRSTDFVGNIEETKIQQIKIDRTTPEAEIYFDKESKSLKIEGIDSLSQTETAQDDKVFSVQDEAGHTLKLAFSELKQHGGEIKAELNSIQYDSNPLYKSSADFKYEWSLDKNEDIKELEQKIEYDEQFEIKAKYSHQKDETRIKIELESGETSEQILAKLIIIKLITKSGGLVFNF